MKFCTIKLSNKLKERGCDAELAENIALSFYDIFYEDNKLDKSIDEDAIILHALETLHQRISALEKAVTKIEEITTGICAKLIKRNDDKISIYKEMIKLNTRLINLDC